MAKPTIGQDADIKADISFGKDLIRRFLHEIREQRASRQQYFWVRERLGNWAFIDPVIVTKTFSVSIFDMLDDGDISQAYFALSNGTADLMILPYHYLDQSRIDWLRNEMRNHLGQ